MPMIFSGVYRLRLILTSFAVSRFYHIPNLKSGSVFGGQVTMTQGKIERYHRSMKNILLLENYYNPSELEDQIELFVDYYNNYRYHEALDNITPTDVYNGRRWEILTSREQIKKKTLRLRRMQNYAIKIA